MSWPNLDSLTKVGLAYVGDLYPVEMLYEFEGPCIFTTRTPFGLLLLAYLVDELDEDEMLRFLVVTTSATTVKNLKGGVTPVRDALMGGSMWLIDVAMSDMRPSAPSRLM